MALHEKSVSFRDTILVTLLILASGKASAGYIYAENASAHRGGCIKASDESPETVLRRNGINAVGSYSRSDLAALAKGIAQVERINGGPLPKAWSTDFNFINARGAWNQASHAINVRKQSYGGDNVAALMHEYGHKLGNANNGAIYSKYFRLAKACGITPYSRKKRTEEFAEVFCVYLVNPDDLKAKCPSAYSAMTEIFKAPENVCGSAGTAIASKQNAKPDSKAATANKNGL
jgi:hypothetical protein